MYSKKELAEHEKTRQGKNICPKCNTPKDMYYKPWCPICEKPKKEAVETLNLIQALTHLEALGNPGIKRRIWEHICERYPEFRNDIHFEMFFDPGFLHDCEMDLQTEKDLMLMKKVFKIKDSILMWVSW